VEYALMVNTVLVLGRVRTINLESRTNCIAAVIILRALMTLRLMVIQGLSNGWQALKQRVMEQLL
jgi:hypothetical protein